MNIHSTSCFVSAALKLTACRSSGTSRKSVARESRATGWPALTGSRAIVIPAIALIMLIVGFFAAYGPARRGLSIQPTEALKAE